jgi:hypothetical protein
VKSATVARDRRQGEEKWVGSGCHLSKKSHLALSYPSTLDCLIELLEIQFAILSCLLLLDCLIA